MRRTKYHASYNSKRKKRIVRKLIERDGLACCFCGQPIELGLPDQDPWRLSIDHLVPLCKGGNSLLTNLRLAHRYCNSLDYRTGLYDKKLETGNSEGTG